MASSAGSRPTLAALQTGMQMDLQSSPGSQPSTGLYSGVSNLDTAIPLQVSAVTPMGYAVPSPRLITPPEGSSNSNNSVNVPLPGYASSPYPTGSTSGGSGLQMAWQMNDNFMHRYGSDGNGGFSSTSQSPPSWIANGHASANPSYSAQPTAAYPDNAITQLHESLNSVLTTGHLSEKVLPASNQQGYMSSWTTNAPFQRSPLQHTQSGNGSLPSASSGQQLTTDGQFAIPSSYIPQTLYTPQANFPATSSHDFVVSDQFQRMSMTGDWKEFVRLVSSAVFLLASLTFLLAARIFSVT